MATPWSCPITSSSAWRPAPARADALPRLVQPARGPRASTGSTSRRRRARRALAQGAQHAGVAPLAARPARPELALGDAARRGETGEHRLDRPGAEAQARSRLPGGEGAVGAGVARDEIAEGVAHGLEERRRHAARRRDAERVPVAADVLRGHASAARRRPSARRRAGPGRAPPSHPRAAARRGALALSARLRARSPSRSSRSCRPSA